MVQFTIVPTSDIITCFQPCCAAPNILNSLLHGIRVADSFGRFRQSLRTDLYHSHFTMMIVMRLNLDDKV